MVHPHNGICSCKKEYRNSIWMGMERLPRCVKWKKARSEKWHYSMLTFVWTGRKIIICMHKETEIMAKKQAACERAMQWAEGGWETF